VALATNGENGRTSAGNAFGGAGAPGVVVVVTWRALIASP
jgi:hypothetical protein